MRSAFKIVLAMSLAAVSLTGTAIAKPSGKGGGAGSSQAGGQNGKVHKSRYPTDATRVVTCQDGEGREAGTITYVGPEKLWPPNHKYSDATVTATDEDADDDVTLTTTATHDQYDAEGNEIVGSGNTQQDIEPAAQTEVNGTGSVSQDFRVRAERSGTRKEGRTYTITADAIFTDSDGDGSSDEMTTCHAEFTIVVPHDMRPSNR